MAGIDEKGVAFYYNAEAANVRGTRIQNTIDNFYFVLCQLLDDRTVENDYDNFYFVLCKFLDNRTVENDYV